MVKQNIFFLSLFLFCCPLFAEISIEEHVKNLSSGTDSEKINACNQLGKEKVEKKYLPEIHTVVKNTNNPKVSISCINAIGYIQEKNSLEILKSKIMSETNSDIIYACLVSLFSIAIKSGYDSDAKSVVQYSDVNHRQDELVADLIDRIKVRFKE